MLAAKQHARFVYIMPLKLTILGSGSAVPVLGRGVTAQFLNINERRFLIDCGEGTQLQLRRFKVKFQRIQAIFISHLHGDHFLGIFGLVSSMSLLGRTKKLQIYGPEGLEEIVRHQFKLAQVYLSFELEFITLSCKDKTLVFEDASIQIFALPLKHRIECYGFLFIEKQDELKIDKDKIQEYHLSLVEILQAKRGETIQRENETILPEQVTIPHGEPSSYSYCTDTRPLAKLPAWIKGARLLYHEATFTQKHTDRAKATGHSTAADAATIAKEAGVGKLLLGHFSTRYKTTDELKQEAQPIFENVTCVEDGDVFYV